MVRITKEPWLAPEGYPDTFLDFFGSIDCFKAHSFWKKSVVCEACGIFCHSLP